MLVLALVALVLLLPTALLLLLLPLVPLVPALADVLRFLVARGLVVEAVLVAWTLPFVPDRTTLNAGGRCVPSRSLLSPLRPCSPLCS